MNFFSIIVGSQQSEIAYRTTDFQDLASATFLAMSPYVSFTHWGRDKRWTIPKAYHVARAKWCDAKKRGVEKPRVTVTDQFGNPFYDWNGNALAFQYWRHFTSRRYSSSHVERALNGQETHYYTSYHGYGRRLVYLDIDAHNQCQKPHLPQAIEFLNRLLKGAFGRKGEGGHNQWIKLKDVPNRDYNEALSRLERAIVALAEKDGQVCSFEVKGKSVTNSIKTFDDTRCHLAKLPYHNHDGRQWSWEMLEEWNDKPDVPWTRFVQWIKELEFLAYGEGEVPSADVDVMTGEVEERVPVELPSFPAGMSLDDIRDIPDAWIRDGLFAKWAARQNQQPLTAEQLLMLDREHEIYHGEWADGLGERMRRYKAIAPHVARGFDSAKCGKPSQRPRLDAALTKWRSRLLPSVSIGYHSGRRMTVMRRVLIGLLAIIEAASQNNGDCPRESIEGWWKELSDDDLMPRWSNELYLSARDVLVRLKLIVIDHDRYQFVPDAKGRCKGIWVTEDDSPVGERHYCYPTFSFDTHTHLYKGYVVTPSSNQDAGSRLSGVPPPLLSHRPHDNFSTSI